MGCRASDLREGVVYSRAELIAAGMHTRIMASSAMARPFTGYYMRADRPADLESLCLVLQERVRPGAVISHCTAAEVYGLPLPQRLTLEHGAPIHCMDAAEREMSGKKLVVHNAEGSAHGVQHHGIMMVPTLRALQQIARELDHVELVICLDALVGGRTEIEAPRLADLRRATRLLRGAGSARLRFAAADARDRVWSPMETRTRLLLVGEGVPEPARNVEIVDPLTGQRFFLDLALVAAKIAIEYDGDQHRTDRSQWQRDRHKDEVLHQLGWIVLRVTAVDLRDPRRFLIRLRAALGRVALSTGVQ